MWPTNTEPKLFKLPFFFCKRLLLDGGAAKDKNQLTAPLKWKILLWIVCQLPRVIKFSYEIAKISNLFRDWSKDKWTQELVKTIHVILSRQYLARFCCDNVQ